ncbi:S8 family peptidase [Phreatobacter sp.]|uniref:S8 family peptidase n=1 Tax=Phreatobacter sp. TaxID=1966341 RepID=UPI003F722E35
MMPMQGVQLDRESQATAASIEEAGRLQILDLLHLLRLNGHQASPSDHRWVDHARERGEDKAFSVQFVDSFADDGPKLVRAAAEGERALRAAGFHLVPLTKYRLTPHTGPTLLDTAGIAAATAQRDWLRTVHTGSGDGPLGKGVTVGILDSGVDSDHPALKNAVRGGRGMVTGEDHSDFGPCTDEKGGHGTHVAGIVGSRDSGLPGVAPECVMRSYRVFPKQDTERGASNFSIINAIRAAVSDGCDIINMSISGPSASDDGVRKAIEEAWNAGVVCIAAAGNQYRRPVGYPARHSICIAVSALGHDGLIPPQAPDRGFIADPRSRQDQAVFLASFSNIGPQIDFAGPGVWIVSTLPSGKWGAMSGTSMAAPAVAGYAAVALSRDRRLLSAPRNASRSEALYQALVSRSVAYDLGSFDFEGYGVPQ